ncbi:MAG TPA: carbamoyltransferase HypF, partial [Deltaproteobacteria bacterium]|nr:carbamoyltransferase HypF [Deltaproteobacteria bacterium]
MDWPRQAHPSGAPEAAGVRRVRTHLRVDGLVQGVGFRPFVHALAVRLRLAGFVANDMQGAVVEVEGAEDQVSRFLERLAAEAPPLSSIQGLATTPLPPTGEVGFKIADSWLGGESQVLVSPDVATCAECIQEIFDPANRRYGYPFTNCTGCGPRFTIV